MHLHGDLVVQQLAVNLDVGVYACMAATATCEREPSGICHHLLGVLFLGRVLQQAAVGQTAYVCNSLL
jgi:hypothetical protein